MALVGIRFLYRRLGGWYPLIFLAVELQSALVIVAATLALFAFYYEGDTSQYLSILLIALALTELTIATTVIRARSALRPISDWIAGKRDPESSNRAWNAAIGLPLFLVKKDLPLPVLATVIPTCIAGIAILHLSWLAIFPLLAGSAVAMGYSATLHYLAVEAGMRPVLIDINQQISPRTELAVLAVPLRWRLLLALPMINLITGLVVAALGGGNNLGLDVLTALLVSTTISLELTVMLTKSILRPINDLERAVEAVNQGRYDVSVPVTTGDELGDLAASFNEMVEGLRERERIREAFGTYLDREIADYILSEGYDEEGVEIEVTVLFTDVEDFTRYAADKTPAEVVSALNRLFEVIVPILARHGGHVDKFEGDGLLAVFGAPEAFADHAERAVRAACEIADAVNREGEAGDLRVGIGVNTGRVVAGSIGGAGRLNFSVIGAAVNVAARVEAATRDVDDSILITSETWKLLSSAFEASSRGKIELKGLDEPLTLFAPQLAGQEPAKAEGTADGDGRTAAWRRRLTSPRLRR
ncbi:MAG: adenylate/guanylate cyclase domain-containing protein [Solirubrobacterales bacterium]